METTQPNEAFAPTWRRFFFESNLFFDRVDGPDDWQRLRDAYPDLTDEQLLDAQEATYRGTRSQKLRDARPNYGFRMEHDGERTLRDFFVAYGMTLPQQKCSRSEFREHLEAMEAIALRQASLAAEMQHHVQKLVKKVHELCG